MNEAHVGFYIIRKILPARTVKYCLSY